jgi:hypothetical protein
MKFQQLMSFLQEDAKQEIYQNIILKDPRLAYKLINNHLDKNKPVSDELLSVAMKDSSQIEPLAHSFIRKTRRIPDAILDHVVSMPDHNALWANSLAGFYVEQNLPIPQRLIETVATSSRASADLILKLLDYQKPVPPILLKNLSDLIMVRNLELAEAYVRRNLPVPEVILNKISEHANWSADLLGVYFEMEKPVPEKLIEGISQSSQRSSWVIATYLGNGKTPPPELIKSVADSISASVRVVTSYLEWVQQPPPQILIDAVSVDPKQSLTLLLFYLTWNRPFPHKLLQSIKDNPALKAEFIERLQKRRRPIPEILQ